MTIYGLLKTERGFRNSLKSLPYEALGQPIQTTFFEPNLVHLIAQLPWVKGRNLVDTRLERKPSEISVRDLSGLYAGKSPPHTSYDVSYETFLDYGRALKSADQYYLANRIGFETDEDFETNCKYLRAHLSWIAATKDGIPVVKHRSWDKSLYLTNIDGGNHFAAVYRQCIEQNRDFEFNCRIEHLSLNVDVCKRVVSATTFLIFPTSVGEPLTDLLVEYGLKLRPTCYEFQKGKSLLVFGWDYSKGQRLSEIIMETLPSQCFFDVRSYLLKALI